MEKMFEGSLGMYRAEYLCAALCALGIEATVEVQYGERITVKHGRTTAGSWLQHTSFYPSGKPLPSAGGTIESPSRYGPVLAAWECACVATPHPQLSFKEMA